MDFGKCHGFYMFQLSQNGKYGVFDCVTGKVPNIYYFFNSSKKSVVKQPNGQYMGGPVVSEDGILKYVKQTYDFNQRGSNSAPKIIKEEVTGQVDLR